MIPSRLVCGYIIWQSEGYTEGNICSERWTKKMVGRLKLRGKKCRICRMRQCRAQNLFPPFTRMLPFKGSCTRPRLPFPPPPSLCTLPVLHEPRAGVLSSTAVQSHTHTHAAMTQLLSPRQQREPPPECHCEYRSAHGTANGLHPPNEIMQKGLDGSMCNSPGDAQVTAENSNLKVNSNPDRQLLSTN